MCLVDMRGIVPITTIVNTMHDMATHPDTTAFKVGTVFCRAAALSFGVILLAWVGFLAGPLWAEASLRRVTDGVMAGDSFRPEALTALEGQLSTHSTGLFPYPDLLRSIAIVRLRQAELAYQAGKTNAENDLIRPTFGAVRTALTVAPTDSFLWFSRSWLAVTSYQSPASIRSSLSLSYRTGAHEGWIASRRALLGLLAYPILDHPLQSSVVGELQDLMQSDQFVPVVAEGLMGPAAKFRDQLLPAFAGSPENSRKKLYAYLTEAGIDSTVPGIPRVGDRPWK